RVPRRRRPGRQHRRFEIIEYDVPPLGRIGSAASGEHDDPGQNAKLHYGTPMPRTRLFAVSVTITSGRGAAAGPGSNATPLGLAKRALQPLVASTKPRPPDTPPMVVVLPLGRDTIRMTCVVASATYSMFAPWKVPNATERGSLKLAVPFGPPVP